MVTTVSQVARTPQGADIVVITESGPGLLLTYAYDRRDGSLYHFSSTMQGVSGPFKAEFWLTQRQ
jgi:hypothetical protein